MSFDSAPCCERGRGGRKGARLPAVGAFDVEGLGGAARVCDIAVGDNASVGVVVVIPWVRGTCLSLLSIATVAGLAAVGWVIRSGDLKGLWIEPFSLVDGSGRFWPVVVAVVSAADWLGALLYRALVKMKQFGGVSEAVSSLLGS